MIAMPLLVLIAVIYPGSMDSRVAHHNADVRSELQRLQVALSDFYQDTNKYPESIPAATDLVVLARGRYRRSFDVSNGVHIYLKTEDAQYAAIAGHPRSNQLYSISSSGPAVYKHSPTNIGSVLLQDRLPEAMVQFCPQPGDKRWRHWRESTLWNEMNLLPTAALGIVVVGCCLLLVKLVQIVWKGVILRVFPKAKFESIPPTETSSLS